MDTEARTTVDQIVERFGVPKRAVVEMVETLYRGTRDEHPGEMIWRLLAGLRKSKFRIVDEREPDGVARSLLSKIVNSPETQMLVDGDGPAPIIVTLDADLVDITRAEFELLVQLRAVIHR